MRSAVVCALLAVAAAAVSPSTSQQMFDNFIIKYHKSYASQEEYNLRLETFRVNLEVANQRNLLGGAQHGVTKFSDLTAAEFKSMYLGYEAGSARKAIGDAPVAQKVVGIPPPLTGAPRAS